MSIKKILTVISLLLFGYIIGIISYRYDFFPIHRIKRIYQKNKKVFHPINYKETDYSDTFLVEGFNNDDFTVIFTFGQSNSGNYGQTKHICQEEVYNWYNGHIYKAKDPLKGATGYKGSVWSRLADKLISRGIYKKILIVPIGVGSTTISQWSTNGEHHNLILETINNLKKDNIEIDLILWHQGESDNFFNTSSDSYIVHFENIRSTFRQKKIDAPIFVAVTSYHPNENALINKQSGCDTIIQNAQKKLVEKYTDVFLGANTDILDKIYYRHDGVHFSQIGLIKHSELWYESIINQIKKGKNN